MAGLNLHKSSSFIVILSLILQSYAPVTARSAVKAEPARAREAGASAEEADGYQPPVFARPQPRMGKPVESSAAGTSSEIEQNIVPGVLFDLPPVTISGIYYTDTVRTTLTQSASSWRRRTHHFCGINLYRRECGSKWQQRW